MLDTLEFPVEGDLDTLDAFLMSDRSPPDSMMLSDLDGFLTAVAVGPEIIMPSQWLPVIFGGEMPEFADAQEAKTVIGAIMSHSIAIMNAIGDGTFEPILWTKPDGTVLAGDWAEGFAHAFAMSAKAWEPLCKSDRFLLLAPILLLGDPDAVSELGLDPSDQHKVLAEAPAVLPHCVIEIDKFWRERRKHALRRGAGTAAPKTGRNEPCPCGSGRKFKKCCGGSVQ